MPSGMDKHEESEKHLKEAINKEVDAIPIPGCRVVEDKRLKENLITVLVTTFNILNLAQSHSMT